MSESDFDYADFIGEVQGVHFGVKGMNPRAHAGMGGDNLWDLGGGLLDSLYGVGLGLGFFGAYDTVDLTDASFERAHFIAGLLATEESR